MTKRIKLVFLFVIWLSVNISKAQIPQDSVKISTKKLKYEEKRELLIEPKNKRQRNKTGITVFISCLFIITTTILLYNVRSK